MSWLAILIAAVAPGVALTAYFYLKDRYNPEPVHLVVRIFIFGILIVFPIMVIQRGIELAFGGSTIVFSFLVSGGVEEFVKWFVLYHAIYRHGEFDEPYDGIVYAVALSLGFATFENVLYALHHSSFKDLVIRAFLPVSGHALFGVLMGYYIGKAKFSPHKEKMYLLYALCSPILWHGAFDYILIGMKTYWVWFMIPFMTFMWIRSIKRINRANATSPYRAVVREE